ncbi:hypothetical protein DENSPDRAFT_879816 [Dentipellis sp. KUC8613]|nr:hypothetical protein DENSPDRAFT_879816 [Dentipellis sp. KUC8613]
MSTGSPAPTPDRTFPTAPRTAKETSLKTTLAVRQAKTAGPATQGQTARQNWRSAPGDGGIHYQIRPEDIYPPITTMEPFDMDDPSTPDSITSEEIRAYYTNSSPIGSPYPQPSEQAIDPALINRAATPIPQQSTPPQDLTPVAPRQIAANRTTDETTPPPTLPGAVELEDEVMHDITAPPGLRQRPLPDTPQATTVYSDIATPNPFAPLASPMPAANARTDKGKGRQEQTETRSPTLEGVQASRWAPKHLRPIVTTGEPSTTATTTGGDAAPVTAQATPTNIAAPIDPAWDPDHVMDPPEPPAPTPVEAQADSILQELEIANQHAQAVTNPAHPPVEPATTFHEGPFEQIQDYTHLDPFRDIARSQIRDWITRTDKGEKLIVRPFGMEARDRAQHSTLVTLIRESAALFTGLTNVEVAPPIPAPAGERPANAKPACPATFILFFLNEEQHHRMLDRGIISCTTITYQVISLQPTLPTLFLTLADFFTSNADVIRATIVEYWTTHTSNAAFDTLNASLMNQITPATVQALIASIRVNSIATRRQGGVLKPHWQVFVASSLLTPEQWLHLRRYLSLIQYANSYHGIGVCIEPFICNICHSAGHPTGMCPFPEQLEWHGLIHPPRPTSTRGTGRGGRGRGRGRGGARGVGGITY